MDHERVGGIPMRRKDLFFVRCELNGRDLRQGPDGLDSCTGGDVPHVERCVRGATSSSE